MPRFLSPSRCFLRSWVALNFWWQNSHSWVGGKCVFRWLMRPINCLNFFGQTSHWYEGGKWIFRWWQRVFGFANDLEQMSHEKGFSPLWVFMCQDKICLLDNRFPHIWHSFVLFEAFVELSSSVELSCSSADEWQEEPATVESAASSSSSSSPLVSYLFALNI